MNYLILVLAYFLGSIPFGYILVRISEGTDIRTVGSGNIGATNVFRKSPWAGVLTFLLDAGKGYLAVATARWMGGETNLQAMAAVAVILGHMFTVFLRFKGGKGVATGCGAFLALSPLAVTSTLVIFVLVAVVSRYISLASITAAAAYPLCLYLFHEPRDTLLWSVIGSAFIVAKHHENIRRLLSGTENKIAHSGRS